MKQCHHYRNRNIVFIKLATYLHFDDAQVLVVNTSVREELLVLIKKKGNIKLYKLLKVLYKFIIWNYTNLNKYAGSR